MELAARRPHISAGIALASAAVIAAAPMAQHLPQLDAARYLPKVSVTDIDLTDAASPMMDLFSGVENQLASLANGAAAAAVPAGLVGAAFDPTQNLVVQSWMKTFQNTATNLQAVLGQWAQTPFVVPQQIAANFIDYASIYVGAFQDFAAAVVKDLSNVGKNGLWFQAADAVSFLEQGNFVNGFGFLYNVGYFTWLTDFEVLEESLVIPQDIATNFANAINYLLSARIPTPSGAIAQLGSPILVGFPGSVERTLAAGVQAAADAWASGDPLGALTNLANIPGVLTGNILNGTVGAVKNALSGQNGLAGLIGNPAKTGLGSAGLLETVLNIIPPTLAKDIVAPNAQNIAQGGSLASAVQNFGNQLINGWPSPASVSTALATTSSQLTSLANNIGTYVSGQLTSLLQSVPSVLSNLPSMVGNLAGTITTQIGTWIAALLRLL